MNNEIDMLTVLLRLQLIRSLMNEGLWEKATTLLKKLIKSVEITIDEDYIRRTPRRASWLYNDFGLDPLGGIMHREGR